MGIDEFRRNKFVGNGIWVQLNERDVRNIANLNWKSTKNHTFGLSNQYFFSSLRQKYDKSYADGIRNSD